MPLRATAKGVRKPGGRRGQGWEGDALNVSPRPQFARKLRLLSTREQSAAMDQLQLLKQLSFGSQVAEEEVQFLEGYFVQTDQWNKIFSGKIDLIRGEKGAGKSAIYLLLGKNSNALLERNIFLVNAENPRGATVFKDLISDPPTSESEFVVLWKVYLLSIICHELRDIGIDGGDINSVFGALEEAGLLDTRLNLAGLLRLAQNFARRLLRQSKLEAGVELDPVSGAPSGIIGRISLAEPTGDLISRGISSLDGMFEKVNASLKASGGYSVWILLDRLDVAFAESHALEANAIKALMKVYSDLRSLEQISFKIFLREDIWKRVTLGGLREASHATRYEVMSWTPETLLNLAIRRILSNQVLIDYLGVNKEEILRNNQKQVELFYRLFPKQVDQGEQKATTFNWMIGRCADATGQTAPRELIQLLNCVRDQEVSRLERGGVPAPGQQLFDRSVFKAALPTVSETRLNTYLYAEYPAEREYIEKLDREKTEQTPESLMTIWNVDREFAIQKAQTLVSLGFFESRGTKTEPTFWVPFLYRDALHLVQGKAVIE